MNERTFKQLIERMQSTEAWLCGSSLSTEQYNTIMEVWEEVRMDVRCRYKISEPIEEDVIDPFEHAGDFIRDVIDKEILVAITELAKQEVYEAFDKAKVIK